MTPNNSDRIKSLQEDRKAVLKRIDHLDTVFKEEKDNEESWPGHAGTRYQSADIDRQVLTEHLRLIEEAIEQLSKKPHRNIK